MANLNVSADRAEVMAKNRARRFRKGVVAMFTDEDRRQKKEVMDNLPPWLVPYGQPQERALGWLSALDIWGEELVPAIMKAAAAHLDEGMNNNWSQFALTKSGGKVSW